jgi:hypothetical protein
VPSPKRSIKIGFFATFDTVRSLWLRCFIDYLLVGIRSYSRQIHCEAFEIRERAVSQSALVGGAQHHARRLACLKCFLPAGRTQTPPITRFQTRKAQFWHPRRRSLPRDLEESRNAEVITAHTV